LDFHAKTIDDCEADNNSREHGLGIDRHGDRSSLHDLAKLDGWLEPVSAVEQYRRSYKVKIKTWTASVAALMLSAAPAFAADSLGQWNYDNDVTPVVCDGYLGADCCGVDCGAGCGCGTGIGAGGLFSGMGYGTGAVEGFSLASAVGMDRSGWDIGGWTQFGYHDRQTPLSETFGDLGAFNDVPGRLNLQQQWFYLGRQADGSNGIGFGGRMDVLYGTDAQKTQSFGNPPNSFDEGWDHGIYGWAMPQLYGEVAMGDLSIIVGKFFTIVGYEVVPAPDNFFYSHALTMFNSEPFTHTGVLTTYSGFDNLTLYNGWTLGWDTGFDNVNSGNNYLGGFGVDLADDINFTYIVTYGNFGDIDGGGRDSYGHSCVLQAGLTDRLSYVFQSDYLSTDDRNADRIDNIGINQYLFYRWNDIVSFGTRIEWWKGEGISGNRASHYAFTNGVNIKLLDNLIMRPEVRKDWNPNDDIDRNMTAVDFILTY